VPFVNYDEVKIFLYLFKQAAADRIAGLIRIGCRLANIAEGLMCAYQDNAVCVIKMH
jgi:hypothetical protein